MFFRKFFIFTAAMSVLSFLFTFAYVFCDISVAYASDDANTAGLAASDDTASDSTQNAEESTQTKTPDWYSKKALVSYRVQTTQAGWTSYKKNGATAGKAVWTAGIKHIQVSLNGPYKGAIHYKLMMRNGRWGVWKSSGQIAGTPHAKNQIQAIKIKITGKLAQHYKLYYRVYAGDYGWLSWTKGGIKTGTAKIKYPIGAIKIRLVAQGSKAPKSSGAKFKTKMPKTGSKVAMLAKAKKYSSKTKWLLLLDTTYYRLAVFKKVSGQWTLTRWIRVAIGRSTSPTVHGTFRVLSKQYSFTILKVTCYWCLRFYNGYFFHSRPCWPGTHKVKYHALGKKASHGCIRMLAKESKWMYKNISVGTKVVSYAS